MKRNPPIESAGSGRDLTPGERVGKKAARKTPKNELATNEPESRSGGIGPLVTSVLANARDAAFIAAIVLYFAGFMYRYAFRQSWGITSPDDTPVYTYMVYAVFPIEDKYGDLLALLIGAAIILIFLDAAMKHWPSIPNLRPVVAGGVIIAVFLVLQSGARDAAVQAFSPLRENGLPGAHFHLSREVRTLRTYDAFINDDKNDLLSIVEETPDTYYVLDQATPGPDRMLPDGVLYHIPKADVDYVTSDIVSPGQPH
jgi:hypothetical protein